MEARRADIREALQADILRLQGFKFLRTAERDVGLGAIADAFPKKAFPLGVVHEFLSPQEEHLAATTGFVTGLLSAIMQDSGVSVWVSTSRKIFAPALKYFGVQPDRVIFLDLKKEKDVIWAMEESLKCPAIAAVVGEMPSLSFTASRRLQLAIEHSGVTGFILRRNCDKITPTVCASRWRISSLPGMPIDELPGVGFPGWKVELLKIKNGMTGSWKVSWVNGRFETQTTDAVSASDVARITLSKTG